MKHRSPVMGTSESQELRDGLIIEGPQLRKDAQQRSRVTAEVQLVLLLVNVQPLDAVAVVEEHRAPTLPVYQEAAEQAVELRDKASAVFLVQGSDVWCTAVSHAFPRQQHLDARGARPGMPCGV